MIAWDRAYLELLRQLEIIIKAYFRYVDDTGQAPEPTPVGLRYVEGSLIKTDQTVSEGEGVEEDVRTFKLLQQIANTLSPTLRVTFKVPSQHQTKKFPILDTQMWMEEGRVMHEFV